MRGLLSIVAVLLLISACAAPPAQLAEHSVDNSKPTIASIYYYISASLMHYEGNYLAASELYRLAQKQDSNSQQIAKQMLVNSAYAYVNGQDTGEDVPATFNAARLTFSFDQELLNAAYSVYNKAQDTAGMQWAVDESVARYPSCRAFLQKYYLLYSSKQQTDKKLLQQAYKLAKGKAEDLVLCGRMYSLVDPKTAREILQEAYSVNPTRETALLVNDLTLRHAGDAEAVKLFNSYIYPQDKEPMRDFLQTAKKTLKLQLLLDLTEPILATKDVQLLAELAFAAYMRYDDNVLLLCKDTALQSAHAPEELAGLAIFLLGQSLFTDSLGSPSQYVEMLYGSRDVDDMLLYRTLRHTLKIQINAQVDTTNFYDAMRNACEKHLAQSPISRYIVLTQEELLNPRDSLTAVRNELSEYFVTHNKGYEEDWTSVISQYLLAGREQEKLWLLRAAVGRFHNNPVFLNDLGYSLLEYPDSLQEAGSLITQALELDPDNAYYHDSMAWFHMLSGNTQKALEYIQVPMQMENLPGEIAYHIGFILEANNDIKNARQYYLKAIDDSVFPAFQEKAKQALQALPKEP